MRSFELNGVRVLPARNLIIVEGAEIRLEPKVMDVLCALIDRRGDVISRDDLVALVWGKAASDEPLTRAISQLRKRLDDQPGAPRFIETIPKRGYRLVC